MLVLSRKPGEALRIGTDLRICVVSATRTQVKLAIEAPEHLDVHREEVFERIADANREAASTQTQTLDVWFDPRSDEEDV